MMSYAERTERPRGLSPEMRAFEVWTVALFCLSLCFNATMYFLFHRRDWLAFPIDLHRSWMFADFLVFRDKYQFFHTASFFPNGLPMVYPTPVAVLFAPFFALGPRYSLPAMLLFCSLAFAIPAGIFWQSLRRRGVLSWTALRFVVILLLLSWPAELIFNGANSEVFVWVALALGMWAYSTGRLWLAAVLLGLAASLKLFPFVFFTLFLSRQHIGKLLVAVLSFFLSFWGSLVFVGPTVRLAWQGFLDGMTFARNAYFTTWRSLEHSVEHSFFGLVKFVTIVARPHSTSDFRHLLSLYQPVSALAGIVLYFGWIRRLPLLNQILTLSVISIYFTPFSGDGTLIHLYYPLAMLFYLSLDASHRQITVPGLGRVIGCMMFCISMESFLVVPLGKVGVRLEGPAHAVALGALLYFALRYPLGPPLEISSRPELLSSPDSSWAGRSDLSGQIGSAEGVLPV